MVLSPRGRACGHSVPESHASMAASRSMLGALRPHSRLAADGGHCPPSALPIAPPRWRQRWARATRPASHTTSRQRRAQPMLVLGRPRSPKTTQGHPRPPKASQGHPRSPKVTQGQWFDRQAGRTGRALGRRSVARVDESESPSPCPRIKLEVPLVPACTPCACVTACELIMGLRSPRSRWVGLPTLRQPAALQTLG